jgi:hypothetical protein
MARWKGLDAFTQGYIEALFFTEMEHGTDRESHNPEVHSSLPGDVTFADLAPEALQSIIADCAAFQRDNEALLSEAYGRGYEEARAGHDYWLTRNGHGAGFWDRSELEPNSDEYEALTAEMIANRDNPSAWDAALAKRTALKSTSLGERLSAACRYQTVDAYMGDDGQIYV